ncbi:MAG: hypothetical protein HZA47_12130 [Planctomycetes bacterium]|uniref:hypothetical protein n=1 Tax=Candidatus Wunengus sp. YC65 TaxID=3367701 RepID=UPI001DFE6D05|nr:hypothetical protein [Planctomycetota bacterium]
MSNTTELDTAVAELNKKLEELQVVLSGYKVFVARASKSMHESIGIFLDKIQAVVEMAYTKNSNFKSLEKTSNEILNEINKLILLKGELHSLSSIEIKDDCSFPRLSKVGAKEQVSRILEKGEKA